MMTGEKWGIFFWACYSFVTLFVSKSYDKMAFTLSHEKHLHTFVGWFINFLHYQNWYFDADLHLLIDGWWKLA